MDFLGRSYDGENHSTTKDTKLHEGNTGLKPLISFVHLRALCGFEAFDSALFVADGSFYFDFHQRCDCGWRGDVQPAFCLLRP